MATLQNIRNRAGVLVAVVIGIALLAFILGDMLKSGRSMFSGSQNEIANVAGKSIPVQLYQQKVEEATENYKRNTNKSALDEETSERIRQQTWNDLIREYVMKKEYSELGVSVSPDELFDMVQGNNIIPEIKGIPVFQNRTTGQFDRSLVIQFLKNIDQDLSGKARQSWIAFEKVILQNRLNDKYNNLIKKGLFVTNQEAKTETQERNNEADIDYILMRYNSISDSSISINDDDISDYYDAHINEFKQDASCDISYITFAIEPSKKDKELAQKWVNDIVLDFKNTEDDVQFVNLNGDTHFDHSFNVKKDIHSQIASFAFSAKVGDIYGPYLENGAYKLSKLSKIAYLPDSVNTRHILIAQDKNTGNFSKAEALIDSLKTLIKHGKSFVDLAKKYSEDQGSADKGGDLGWLQENSISKAFSDSCFFAKKGDLVTVKTQYGVHLIEILDQSKKFKKVQIATLDRKIEPSSETYQQIYSLASKFAGLYNTQEKFDEAVKNQNITKKVANNLRINDKKISGLDSPRELVKWAFKAEKGEGSPIFEFGNKFVVATLTDVREDGFASIEQVKSEIEIDVKREKKSEKLVEQINELNKKNINELSKSLNAEIKTAKDIKFSSFGFPGLGVEPNLNATAITLPKDKLSEPIIGNNGIYVIVVKSIKKPNENLDINKEKVFLTQNLLNQIEYHSYEALKENSNIKDSRSKFY
ncbi:MAG: SurA N-terminal domain-containing protein [Bacteroidetes bacterium]|nr:SurA N-terminal domain-containing protein [Bacteroidota bacterium]